MSTMANSKYFLIFCRLEIIRAASEIQKAGSQPINSRMIPNIAKSSYIPERLVENSRITAIRKDRILHPKRMTGIKQRIFKVFIYVPWTNFQLLYSKNFFLGKTRNPIPEASFQNLINKFFPQNLL